MRNLIEIVLEEKTKELPTSILYNQWEFDKRLIPSALQAVSAIFPHYSLHNESHSETIISNFIKILGESVIRQLSATDLWLLLESAYCHDLGMIVTAEKAKEAIDSGKILEHFKQIQNDATHELYFCTKKLKIDNNRIVFIDNDFSITKTDTVKYLLADFFRKQHGANVSGYIISPHSTLSLSSPRAIIPNRLYELLGKICEAHTKDFNSVMGLPRMEDGIDIESTHPRFIACMLRLGDLLDIDNGRFSETLLRTLGEIPDSTNAHKDKHMSTKHKSINTKEIEIIAECQDKNVAHITQQWFNWIQEEFTVQTLSWNNVVPPNLNTFLPSVNKLNVSLIGYEYIDPKAKPVFTVDTPKALELLQGANFYESPFKAIRELLQNAIDATLIRVWEENKQNIQSIADLLKITPQYTINVIIEDNSDGYTNLAIIDKGTGISRKDLKYLSSTGSSSKNSERKNRIVGIPEWMQPVGVFGIGFQSAFLLTDLVEISTNSIYTNEAYTVELHSPQSQYKGDIYLKELMPKNKVYNYGTVLNLKIDNKKAFDKNSIKSNVHKFSDDYSFAYFGILEELRNIAKYSFIPIQINDSIEVREDFDFTSSNFIELKLIPDKRSQEFYFKNIRTSGFGISHFYGVINYHLNQSTILNLSRKEVRDEYENLIKAETIKAFTEYFYSLANQGRSIPIIILWILYLNSTDENLKKQLKPFVLNVSFNTTKGGSKSITISEILTKDEITYDACDFRAYGFEEKDNKIFIECGSYIRNPEIELLLKELSSNFEYISHSNIYSLVVSNSFGYASVLNFSKNEINCKLSIQEISEIIKYFRQNKNEYFYIPCVEKYKKLRLPYNKEESIDFICRIHLYIPYTCILFPLIKVSENEWMDGRTEKFYNWIMDNIEDKNMDINSIKSLYDNLIEDFKSIGFLIINK